MRLPDDLNFCIAQFIGSAFAVFLGVAKSDPLEFWFLGYFYAWSLSLLLLISKNYIETVIVLNEVLKEDAEQGLPMRLVAEKGNVITPVRSVPSRNSALTTHTTSSEWFVYLKGEMELAQCIFFGIWTTLGVKWLIFGSAPLSVYPFSFRLFLASWLMSSFACSTRFFIDLAKFCCELCLDMLATLWCFLYILPESDKEKRPEEGFMSWFMKNVELFPRLLFEVLHLLLDETEGGNVTSEVKECTDGNNMKKLPCGHLLESSCSVQWDSMDVNCLFCRQQLESLLKAEKGIIIKLFRATYHSWLRLSILEATHPA